MTLKAPFNLLVLLVLLFGFFACKPTPEPPSIDLTPVSPLVGSWEITSIYWITKDTTYSIEEAQPGLLLITPERYALQWTPTAEPRVPFGELSAPSDEEILAGFRSVVFNAGTYTRTDSTLSTQAQIAKVPGFEGGQQFYRYSINDDTMELTMFDETYPDGGKPKWFGTFETKFVLQRVSE